MQFPQVGSVAEFVAWEELQDDRFEFADGEISCFPGGTLRHEIIIANLVIHIGPCVRPGSVRTSGLKLVTEESSRYADVTVGFDPRDAPDQRFSRFPTLVIEVLSPSTHQTDRGPKFDEYRTIETLREYVLVDSRKRWVQTIRRAGNDWIVSLPILQGAVWFESISASIAFDDVYAGAEL